MSFLAAAGIACVDTLNVIARRDRRCCMAQISDVIPAKAGI
ncbi:MULTISPECIES: hypothetical protein [unclassified Rickettsia]